jgi:serine/threonine protein phosphatase PrpC
MKFEIDYGTDFIVLGSDGFFEFFSPSDVVSYTYKLLRKGSINLA